MNTEQSKLCEFNDVPSWLRIEYLSSVYPHFWVLQYIVQRNVLQIVGLQAAVGLM